MTIAEAKHALITTAKNEIGYHEGNNNYNKYAIGMAKYYGMDMQNQPYCDIFTDWCFIKTFGGAAASKMTYQPIGAFSAACRYSAQYFKENNAWFKTPEIGDIIFFYYDGAINHQGIVVEISGGVVYTIEGNSSDMVRSNAYALSEPKIAGYGRPNWSVVSSSSTNPVTGGENTTVNQPSTNEPVAAPAVETCTITITLPVIKYGDEDKGKDGPVKLMQQRLIAKGYSCGVWGADGDYGNGTKGALLKFQKDNKLEQDGVCGKQTWSALFK